MEAPDDIALPLRPSRILACGLAVAHAAAIAAVAASGLAAPAAILAGAVLAVSGVGAVRRVALLTHRRSVRALAVAAGCRGTLYHADGSRTEGDIDRGTLVLGLLVVLVVRDAGGRRVRAVVAPDMTSAAQCRRLRVMLRWGRPQAGGVAGTVAASMIRPR